MPERIRSGRRRSVSSCEMICSARTATPEPPAKRPAMISVTANRPSSSCWPGVGRGMTGDREIRPPQLGRARSAGRGRSVRRRGALLQQILDASGARSHVEAPHRDAHRIGARGAARRRASSASAEIALRELARSGRMAGGVSRGRVVIVGAGLGGLAAACHLAGRGHDVTVLERGDGPGGRAGPAGRTAGIASTPAPRC